MLALGSVWLAFFRNPPVRLANRQVSLEGRQVSLEGQIAARNKTVDRMISTQDAAIEALNDRFRTFRAECDSLLEAMEGTHDRTERVRASISSAASRAERATKPPPEEEVVELTDLEKRRAIIARSRG